MNSRVQSIVLRGKVERRDLAAPFLIQSGDSVLVVRGKPRILIIRCPCGCGDDLLINLDKRSGPAWRLYEGRKGLTLHPSYWRDGGCGSHFIIWHNHIYWCLGWESDESEDWSVSQSIEESVWAALSEDDYVEYEDIAEKLDLIPWEVLQACRQLINRGLAEKMWRKGRYRRLPKKGISS